MCFSSCNIALRCVVDLTQLFDACLNDSFRIALIVVLNTKEVLFGLTCCFRFHDHVSACIVNAAKLVSVIVASKHQRENFISMFFITQRWGADSQ